MVARDIVEAQLPHTIQGITVAQLGGKYEGKVRDCFTVGDRRVLVTSDRLSAFDRVLTTIPFKGQLLNDMAHFWFEATKNLVPNHVIARPHPNVFVAREVEILPVEVVIRGYLTGSAWRDYEAGRPVSGITLPAGMKRSQQFDKPLLTPSTKAEKGKHDEPISSEEIVRSGLVEKRIWDQVTQYASALFEFGTKSAAERGLILVDTKYEFGVIQSGNQKGQVLLADEIHTQDSSRYWIAQSYQSAFEAGEDPQMLDKEFVRRWLIERGYMGDGTPPDFDDAFRVDTALKYIDACERITGRPFQPLTGPQEKQIVEAIRACAF